LARFRITQSPENNTAAPEAGRSLGRIILELTPEASGGKSLPKSEKRKTNFARLHFRLKGQGK